MATIDARNIIINQENSIGGVRNLKTADFGTAEASQELPEFKTRERKLSTTQTQLNRRKSSSISADWLDEQLLNMKRKWTPLTLARFELQLFSIAC